MKTQTGYLTRLASHSGSGLATVVFRSTKKPGPKTQYTTTYIESGFGMRQLASALGINGELTVDSAHIRVRYTIDDLGILSTVEPQ